MRIAIAQLTNSAIRIENKQGTTMRKVTKEVKDTIKLLNRINRMKRSGATKAPISTKRNWKHSK
jgi:hypothetical protein